MSPFASGLEAAAGGGLLETPLATVVGIALLHFVWQGFALGALIAGLLAALRHRPAAVRYAVCVAGMGVLLAAPVVTALLLLGAIADPWSAAFRPLIPPLLAGTGAAAALASPLGPMLPRLSLLWATGVLTLQVRTLVGWMRANRLRRLDTRPAPARWQRELDTLRSLLAVRRPVRLLESSRVVVPAVVGWLRPVVLLPASLVTGLGPDAIRGLLAHELAHVRRHDYLVNAAQCVFESLLFFHPVTWWLSGRLRAEREFCCDDVALTVGGGALAYARTLSSLEELRDRTPLPALSAKGGSLMSRIMRMVGPKKPTSGRASLVVGLLAVAGGITFGALMATGCFQGDPVAPAEAAVLTGPSTGSTGPEFAAASPEVRDEVLANLEAAGAEGKISADLLTTIRAKIESGEATVLAGTCVPGDGCELSVDCEIPAGCTTATTSATFDFVGAEEGEARCIVVTCDDESACESIAESAGTDPETACRTILESAGAGPNCCPQGPQAKASGVELVEITEDGC